MLPPLDLGLGWSDSGGGRTQIFLKIPLTSTNPRENPGMLCMPI